ncbi:MAG: hypothetical protein LBG09_00825 [Puniceicoccales bacterium]|nr:hypothetical protein [Puniceicoccales bacterium]
MKEKTLKILLGMLSLGVHSVGATVPSGNSAAYFKQSADSDIASASTKVEGLSQIQAGLSQIQKGLAQIQAGLSLPQAPQPQTGLPPAQIVARLHQLINDGTINKDTIVVFDIDNTLFKEGSDQMPSGATPIDPGLAPVIKKMQNTGATVIALTNGGSKCEIIGLTNPVVQLTCEQAENLSVYEILPDNFQGLLDDFDPIPFEFLRIEGLRSIGIDFSQSFKGSISKKLNQDIGVKHEDLGKGKSTSNRLFELQEKNFPALGSVRIPNGKQLIEICVPYVINGIIFSNFSDPTLQARFGFIKGEILELLFNECKEFKIFSNVVFIDDFEPCVKNVQEVMKKRNMPCIAMQIVPE